MWRIQSRFYTSLEYLKSISNSAPKVCFKYIRFYTFNCF
ncbi:Hypothetical protein BN2458_PEG1209 [Helicobacter typhlonius]|uniref:Uncharacterized protein n=1 Tax=Helicobacter typhlonius TaxID=76936 RepID=A0A0S4PY13_9HELI|nr:Hypothetical protein BN2458_PEG1209 [Helicobacter typhlonius]